MLHEESDLIFFLLIRGMHMHWGSSSWTTFNNRDFSVPFGPPNNFPNLEVLCIDPHFVYFRLKLVLSLFANVDFSSLETTERRKLHNFINKVKYWYSKFR